MTTVTVIDQGVRVTFSPQGRNVFVGTVMDPPVSGMLASIYDSDANGIVDKAEGIPVLLEVPSDLSGYSDGDMFKVGTRTYVVDKPA
ncbi:MAG: hypothetical protein ACYDG4_15255 [Desulfuromonadaceae bacterium]